MSDSPDERTLGAQTERFLHGGGEMGALMRAHDWAATPLGPPGGWPQSLRTALNVLLDNHYPMYIAWGRSYIQFYNDAYRPILGSKHPEALGRGTPESFGEIWDFVQPIFDRVMTDGEPTYLEDQLLPLNRHAYVEECYFTYCDSAIRDESGGVGGVLVTIIETTERVLRERRMRTLRDLGAAAVEAATPAAVWTAAAEILGRNALDLPFFALYRLDDDGTCARRAGIGGLPADHPAFALAVERAQPDDRWGLHAVAQQGVAHLVRDLDDGLACGPWPEAPREALVLPIVPRRLARAAGLLVAGVSGRRALDEPYRTFLTDVAAHVATGLDNAQAHEEERRRAEGLAELDRAKTVFFSNVSHEFRTPLALILDPLATLAARADLDADTRATLALAHRNATRLLKLVNTLLDFSRIEAGRADASFAPVDLATRTAELASAFESAVAQAGLALVVRCPPLPQPVYVDLEMWEKVVLNLVSNALKFTFEGAITVAVEDHGTAARLVVADTGVGIPAEELPRVFERFHRVRGTLARTQEGTGIGLALVRDLVRLHGGTVEVASRPDAGTTFSVTLPYGVAHLPPDRVHGARTLPSTALGALPFVSEALRWQPGAEGPAAMPRARPPREPVTGPRPRILLADDNADMREYLRRILATDWDVEAWADGRAALAAARRRPPDLVLSDVMMPGLDGFELLRALRDDPATRGVPIVLLSARAGEEATVDALLAGADDYLIKPFSARELHARVRAQLALAAMRRRVTALEERQRLALDLHDSVTQTLIAITLLAGKLPAMGRAGEGELAAGLARLREMADYASAEMRMLLHEMRPEALERAELAGLLQQAVELARTRAPVEARVVLDGDDPSTLPGEVRLACYRIVQECLNNVVRHAEAQRVEVRLQVRAGALRLTVEDDGRGFDPAVRRGGIGVGGMQERARAVGARLTIRSRPGGGTAVALQWPDAGEATGPAT